MIPWSRTYWTNERPDHDLIRAQPEEHGHQVFRIFCIRQLIWRRKQLSLEDQEFWESAKSRVSTCPVFHRLEPSRDIVRADRRIERQMDACEAALEAEAEANKDAEEPT